MFYDELLLILNYYVNLNIFLIIQYFNQINQLLFQLITINYLTHLVFLLKSKTNQVILIILLILLLMY